MTTRPTRPRDRSSTTLTFVVAYLSGLLVGITYQRAGGWWGTLALPLTVGPILVVSALFAQDAGPFSTSALVRRRPAAPRRRRGDPADRGRHGVRVRPPHARRGRAHAAPPDPDHPLRDRHRAAPAAPHTLMRRSAMPVIQVEHLHKRYGDTVAVDDVSLEVHRGEIFGVLGRNGAGKTTTVEIVGGLREADSGTVRVLGLDPRPGPQPAPGGRRPPAPGEPAPAEARRARGARPVRVVLPGPRRPGAAPRRAGADRPGRRAVRPAVRRPEAAAVGRARARRQPAGRHPRRAHHGPRPARAPGHLGRGGAHPRPRRDDRAGHAPHGGGRAALRPDRADRRRSGRRDGDAGGAGRAGDRRAGAAVPPVGPGARSGCWRPSPPSRTPTTAPRGPRPGQRRAGRARRAGPARHPPREPAPRAELAGGRLRRTHQPPWRSEPCPAPAPVP